MKSPKNASRHARRYALLVIPFLLYLLGSGPTVSLRAQPLPIAASPDTALSASGSSSSQNCTIIVHVHGVRNRQGVVRLLLFTNEEGWPDEKGNAYRSANLPANGGTVTFTLTGLPAAVYAVSVLHDENENHKLDRDLFGRPKEGIGFSNNPKIGFTTPSWKSAAIVVNGKLTEVTVEARYA